MGKLDYLPMSGTASKSRYSKPTSPFPAAEHLRRIDRLNRRVAAAGLDALVVEGLYNRFYFSGLRATNGRLLLRPGKPAQFHTDFRYMEMARVEIPESVTIVEMPRQENLRQQLAPLAQSERWRRVGYEAGSMSARRYQAYLAALEGVKEWVDFEPTIMELRAIKSPAEVARLRRAIKVNDQVFAASLRQIRPGMSEWEIHTLLRTLMATMGQGEGWESIVGAGANSSKCHHHTTGKTLGPRSVLLIDMGVKVEDYISDMTRTVFFGPPSGRMREIYRIVLEANCRAIAAIRPGKKCSEIDRVARGFIDKRGFGKRFGHGLGHGLGLEVHEDPYFNQINHTPLAPGMVMTVEPGIYLPGQGGVRIEDVVLVTRTGCEVITTTPKEMLVL
jgi:Xaa-Pro aminopeptidase